jgi:hypothetical protein
MTPMATALVEVARRIAPDLDRLERTLPVRGNSIR